METLQAHGRGDAVRCENPLCASPGGHILAERWAPGMVHVEIRNKHESWPSLPWPVRCPVCKHMQVVR